MNIRAEDITYKKILVPLDGSALAEAALPYATFIANKHGSELILLTVGSTPSNKRINTFGRAYLEQQATKLEAEGTKVSTEIVYGNVSNKIVEFADKNDVDLIAISTHGYSGLKRLMLGSVAGKVIGNTYCPVLLIRSTDEAVPRVGCSKILLPLDGSFFSEVAIPYAEEMARGTGADIVLLAVTEVPDVPSDRSPAIKPSWEEYRDALAAESRQQAQSYLDRVKVAMKDRKVKVSSQIVTGDIAGSICDTVDCEHIDMVVMATHGRSGVSRLVFGSVARRIVDESTQVVLLVRPTVDKGDQT